MYTERDIRGSSPKYENVDILKKEFIMTCRIEYIDIDRKHEVTIPDWWLKKQEQLFKDADFLLAEMEQRKKIKNG